MENYDFNPAKEAKDVKDIEDAVKKIAALQRQINNPTRDGMINALSDAQSTAGKEIQQLEYSQGDTIPTPWVCFRDQDWYRKLSQYQDRILDNLVVPITNKAELKTIEEAKSIPYDSVRTHVSKALALYADRKAPDYENSIKESISAVEAMCCIITGLTGTQATLGAAIKKLKDNGVHIHRAMESAFSSLYGYTSDENGIRHGGIDFTNAPAEDAKYMLISCSAFVNYLMEKWSKVQCAKQ